MKKRTMTFWELASTQFEAYQYNPDLKVEEMYCLFRGCRADYEEFAREQNIKWYRNSVLDGGKLVLFHGCNYKENKVRIFLR